VSRLAAAEEKIGPGGDALVSKVQPESGEAERRRSENEDYVTRKELAEALDRVEKRQEAHLAEQFRTQALAIGSLRAMIADTDALLERILERLEAYADSSTDSFGQDERVLARRSKD